MFLYFFLFIFPFFYFLYKLRYGSSVRTFLLILIQFLQGKKTLVLNSDDKLCKLVLDSSDAKGKGIEYFFSMDGWAPIYNSESVDGERWRKLLAIFRKIVPCLSYSERLENIMVKHVSKIFQEKEILDSQGLELLTLRVFFELLIKQEIRNAEDEEVFLRGTKEWRKHVAQKGSSSLPLKHEMINKMIEYLSESEFNLENIKTDHKATTYEAISMFLQPFIISPIINFTDIFSEFFLFLESNPEYKEKLKNSLLKNEKNEEDEESISLILCCVYETLRLKHPFPILERDVLRTFDYNGRQITKGTHVYIELDNFSQEKTFFPERWQNKEYQKNSSWILFATGPRMCAGKQIAIIILEGLIKNLLLHSNFDWEKIKVWVGHGVSGRRNDNSFSLEESSFQIKALLKCLGTISKGWLVR
jgi:hypothetical protein